MQLIIIILRTFFFYFFILVILRVMGKKVVGQLSINDFIISILISDLVVLGIEKYDSVGPIILICNDYDQDWSDDEITHITHSAIDDFVLCSYILENESLDSLKNTAHYIIKNESSGDFNE